MIYNIEIKFYHYHHYLDYFNVLCEYWEYKGYMKKNFPSVLGNAKNWKWSFDKHRFYSAFVNIQYYKYIEPAITTYSFANHQSLICLVTRFSLRQELVPLFSLALRYNVTRNLSRLIFPLSHFR